jgi:beta-glucosidase
LKNDGLLPLDKKNIKTLAVIGSVADVVHLDWYSGTPPYHITPLTGLKNKLGTDTDIIYAANNSDGKAVEAAKKADAVIIFVGNDPICQKAGWAKCYEPSNGREAVDRQSLTLPEEDLIKLIYQANPNTVVGLLSSFPYAINWSQQHIPAILHATHNSQELGTALANVIFGEVNPAGRLTQTWVKSITDLPDLLDYDITRGRTYMYFKGDPLYAFGHGLSYTSFDYRDLSLELSKQEGGNDVKVSFELTNSGDVDGEEVVQLYVRHLNSKIQRPLKELKNFKRIYLKKGESLLVTMELDTKDLMYWDTKGQRFKLEKDTVEVQIGSASDNLKLKGEVNIN